MGRIEIINSARRNLNKGAGQLPTTRQPPRGRKHITQTYVILEDRKSAVLSANKKVLVLDPMLATGNSSIALGIYSVSYTHLTLPTKRIV